MALSVIGQAATADSFIGHLKNKIYTWCCCCWLKITFLSADDTPGFCVTTVDLEFQCEQQIVSQHHVHTEPRLLFTRDCVCTWYWDTICLTKREIMFWKSDSICKTPILCYGREIWIVQHLQVLAATTDNHKQAPHLMPSLPVFLWQLEPNIGIL